MARLLPIVNCLFFSRWLRLKKGKSPPDQFTDFTASPRACLWTISSIAREWLECSIARRASVQAGFHMDNGIELEEVFNPSGA
jgi:hypothetical protein